MYACIRKRTFLSLSLSLFLSLGACSRRLRTRTLTRDSDTILHSNAGQEAPASLVHRPRISTGSRSASSLTLSLSFSLPPARLPCALSFAPKGLKRDAARNKNNKKCFLPFCLYISHLALRSISSPIYSNNFFLFSSRSVYLFVKLKPDVAQFADERDLKLKFNRRVYR